MLLGLQVNQQQSATVIAQALQQLGGAIFAHQHALPRPVAQCSAGCNTLLERFDKQLLSQVNQQQSAAVIAQALQRLGGRLAHLHDLP